jgi:hypothetical protein
MLGTDCSAEQQNTLPGPRKIRSLWGPTTRPTRISASSPAIITQPCSRERCVSLGPPLDSDCEHRFAKSPDLFASTCATMFARMLDTVPSGVELTDVIDPLPIKPASVALVLDGDKLKLSGLVRVRSTHGASHFSFTSALLCSCLTTQQTAPSKSYWMTAMAARPPPRWRTTTPPPRWAGAFSRRGTLSTGPPTTTARPEPSRSTPPRV